MIFLSCFVMLFRYEFNKFNNTEGAQLLDSIYHIILKLL